MTNNQNDRSFEEFLKLWWVLVVIAGTASVLGICDSSAVDRSPMWVKVYVSPAILIFNVVAFYFGIRCGRIAIPVFGVVVAAMSLAFSEFMYSFANMNDAVAPPLWSFSDTISVIGALVISIFSFGVTFALGFAPLRQWMERIETKYG